MPSTTPLVLRASMAIVAMGMALSVAAQPVDPAVAVVCASKPGERQTCAADTTGGVTLVRSTGTVACELGTSWGFDQKSIWVQDGCSAEFSLGTKPSVGQGFGRYVPGRGFKVADTSKGEMNIDLYGVVRYLNQRALDPTYTDSFGNTRSIKQRQDIQFNKAIVFFQGWLMSPQFTYSAYVWTTNTSQGLPAQVVLAGLFAYTFNPRVALGVGISGLPGVRSTEGQWPLWLGTDQRLIADEFFRPSYTSGLFARGEVAKGLRYSVMWGDNLSQLGVDAGQLGNNMSAVSGSLVWMPTTGEYGAGGGFGDFERHDAVAKREGLREYGTLGQRYACAFDQKWLRGGAPPDEPLIGSGDFQSLADLSYSFEQVQGMKLAPFTTRTLLHLAVVTLLPVAPLMLTMFSMNELFERLLKMF